MDLGKFFGSIGSNVGGFFGALGNDIFGNNDAQKKKQQQAAQQAGQSLATHYTQQAQQQNNSAAAPQTPSPLTPQLSQQQAPKLGGVQMDDSSSSINNTPISGQPIALKDSPHVNTPAPQPKSFLDNINDFTAQANDALYGGLVRGGANIVNSVATGFNPDETKKRTDGFLQSIGESDKNNQSQLAQGTDKNSTAGRLGQSVGGVEKAVVENAPFLAMPGTSAIDALPMAARLGINGGIGAGTGFVQGMGSGDSLNQDLINAGLGGVAGSGVTLASPLVGSMARKVIGHLTPSETPEATVATTNLVDNEGDNLLQPTEQPPSQVPENPTVEPTAPARDPNHPIQPSNSTDTPPPAITSPNRPVESTPTTAQPAATPGGVTPPILDQPVRPTQSIATPAAPQEVKDVQQALDKAATTPEATPAPVENTVVAPASTKAAEKAAAQTPQVTPQEVEQALKTETEKSAPTTATPASDEVPFTEDGTAAKVDDTQPVEQNPDAVARVNAAKRAFLSKTNVIRATNTDAGHELANGMEAAEDGHLNYTGNWMSQLKQTFKLNKGDFEKAWRVQEGEIDPATVSSKVAQAANELKTVMPQIQKAAEKADVVSGDLGDSYMPHVYPKDGATVVMPGDDLGANARKYGNLEKERTSNDKNYQRTPEVLQNYIDRAAQRVAQAEQFGSKNEVAKNLIGKIKAEGGDKAIADKAFSNYYNPPTTDSSLANFSKGVRTVQAALQLPKAAISHLAQGTNVAADTGIINTAKALGKTIFKPGESAALAERAGVTTPQALGHYTNEYTSFGNKLANKLTAPFLKPVMKFNRTLAANAYDQAAAKMAAKGDIQGLRDLGVQGDIGNTLTDDQALQAARGGTKRTMFVNSAADTPVNAETPWGKAVWQYRGAYARPQTGFIYNNVLKPAAQGHLAPLARYATLGTAGAAGTNIVKNALTPGQPNDPATVAAQTAPQMLGLPGEIGNSIVNYGASNPTGVALGTIAPILGEGSKLLDAAGQSARDKSATPLERYGLKKVPFLGHELAANLTPTQAQQSGATTPGAPTPSSTGNPIADFVNGIFHPAPPDAVSAEMDRLGNDAGSKFSPGEKKALASKDVSPLAHNLINDPLYQAADDQAKSSMIKKVLSGTATKGISSSLSDADKQALLDAKIQTPADKTAWLDDNTNAAAYYTAQYNNAVANKSINPQLDNDLSNKKSLKYQMVAAQVDEKLNTDPTLKADYKSTTPAQFTALLNPKSATYDVDAAKTLYEYDQARAAAGLPPKYDMNVTNKSLAKSAGSGSGSGPKTFAFPSLPASLTGTGTSGSGKNSGYAAGTSLFTPIPALVAPTTANIPQGRSISVKPGVSL